MTFRSLHQILRAPAYQRLLRDAEAAEKLRQAWQESAGPQAIGTRPIDVRGDTLWVAVSRLTFKHFDIFTKLPNDHEKGNPFLGETPCRGNHPEVLLR